MRDIVEDALEAARDAHETGDGPDADAFAPPRPVLVGCGAEGARIAARGWDAPRSSFHDLGGPTVAVGAADRLPVDAADLRLLADGPAPLAETVPATVPDADVAVLTADLGRPDDGYLAAAVADALPSAVTTVAVPTIPFDENARRDCGGALSALVDGADTTVPYDLGRLPEGFASAFEDTRRPDPAALREFARPLVGELATDVVTMLSGRLARPSRRTNPWDVLDAGGLVAGFHGRIDDDPERTPEAFAETLVGRAVERPISTGVVDGGDGLLGCLFHGHDTTLAEVEAVRETVPTRFGAAGVDTRADPFAATTTERPGRECRMTVLVTGLDRDRFPGV